MTALFVLLLACGAPVGPTPPGVGRAEAESSGSPPSQVQRLQVRALSFPAGWLAQRVGGERVSVVNILPEGEDAPLWQPPPDLVASLADADLIVANGAGFEAWTKTASLPVRKVVNTADGLDLLEVAQVTHSHGAAGEHSHAGIDPHTWSDPLLLLDQARALRAALARADADGASTYDADLEALARDLVALHGELEATLAPAKGLRIAANHPAYGYLARRYGLDIRPFDLDPGASPSAQQAAAVAAWVAEAGNRPLLFWEEAPTIAVVAALPEGIEHVVIDPLEQPAGGSYDYLTQSRANADTFARLFAP